MACLRDDVTCIKGTSDWGERPIRKTDLDDRSTGPCRSTESQTGSNRASPLAGTAHEGASYVMGGLWWEDEAVPG